VFGVKDATYPFSRTYLYGISFLDPKNLGEKTNKVINLKEPVKKFVIDIDKKRENKNDRNLRINFKVMKDLPFEI